MLFAAADADVAWVFIELGAAVFGLAILTRLAHRLGFSSIPLYLLGGLAFGRLFIKIVLGQTLRLNDAAWRTLTWRWAVFFVVLAVLNEIVWRNVSTNAWVAFKVWAIFPLTLLFAMAQAPYIARHQIEDEPSGAR